MKKRKHLTPEQRLLVLAEFQESSLSVTAFAKLKGISAFTLRRWHKAHRPSRFLPARILAQTLPNKSTTPPLRLLSQNGLALEIPAGCDPAWLAALIRGVV